MSHFKTNSNTSFTEKHNPPGQSSKKYYAIPSREIYLVSRYHDEQPQNTPTYFRIYNT